MHCDRLTENYLWRGKLKIHEKVEETGRSKSQMREEETGWRSELGKGEAEGFSEMEGETGEAGWDQIMEDLKCRPRVHPSLDEQ